MSTHILVIFPNFQPLPGQSQSPNSYVDNVGNAPAAAPTPSSDASSFSLSGGTGSSVASGSVWDRLSGSQQMKVRTLEKARYQSQHFPH